MKEQVAGTLPYKAPPKKLLLQLQGHNDLKHSRKPLAALPPPSNTPLIMGLLMSSSFLLQLPTNAGHLADGTVPGLLDFFPLPSQMAEKKPWSRSWIWFNFYLVNPRAMCCRGKGAVPLPLPSLYPSSLSSPPRTEPCLAAAQGGCQHKSDNVSLGKTGVFHQNAVLIRNFQPVFLYPRVSTIKWS